jgi:hypothetical protein
MVSARSAVMAAWAAKPYPTVSVVASRIVKPRIASSLLRFDHGVRE